MKTSAQPEADAQRKALEKELRQARTRAGFVLETQIPPAHQAINDRIRQAISDRISSTHESEK